MISIPTITRSSLMRSPSFVLGGRTILKQNVILSEPTLKTFSYALSTGAFTWPEGGRLADLLLISKSNILLGGAIKVEELKASGRISFWGVTGCSDEDIHFLQTLGLVPDVNVVDREVDDWIERIEGGVEAELARVGDNDGAHDFGHLQRVSALGRQFAREELADELVVYAAGMLHDIVNLRKDHPEASRCSLFAAARAEELLVSWNFPRELIPKVCHAIHAHSFSAKVEPKTSEAKCLQDADRMEALGAFGVMRAFYVAGKLGLQILDEEDPAALNRPLNDKRFGLDHFVQKLFTLQGTMKTAAGRKTAESLSGFLNDFRDDIIKDHMAGDKASGRFLIAMTCYRAGQSNLPLLHPTDPFAKKWRNIDHSYALDRLLVSDDPDVRLFIVQLRFELNGYQAVVYPSADLLPSRP